MYKVEAELEKARREVLKDGDRLRMYRKWETRFKNKKLPEIMPMFYRQCSEYKSNWQPFAINQPYDKK